MGFESIPQPGNYFSGVLSEGLVEPDNILMFQRTAVADLQHQTFETRPHHRYVLVFNLRSDGLISLDGKAFRFPEGHALLIHPFRFHHFHGLETESLCWVFLTFEERSPRCLEVLRDRVVKLGTVERRLLEEVADLFIESRKGAGRANLVVLKCAEFLERLKQVRGKPLDPVGTGVEDGAVRTLRKIDEFLAANLSRGIGVGDVAAELGMSESNLRMRFRGWFGITLGSYLRHFKLTHAISLLRSSKMPMGEIAADCGFTSQSAFSRAFREQLQCSPREYALRMSRFVEVPEDARAERRDSFHLEQRKSKG